MALLLAADAALAFTGPALAMRPAMPAVQMKAEGEIGVTPPCALAAAGRTR